MTTPIGFDPSTYSSTTEAPFVLGQEFDPGDGKVYRYAKFVDAIAYANGQVVELASTTAFHVTNDRAGGSSLGRLPVGVCLRVMAQNEYGWVLVRGRHTAIKDAANAAVLGVKQMSHATADGDAAPATAYTSNWFCVALANASGGTFPGEIRI